MNSTDESRPPLDPRRLPHTVEVVEEAGSTNALVAARAREGAEAGLVIVAEHQTSGRGRLDRSWEVPPRAALTFSMLVRPSVEPASWPWLPLLTGYAVHAALDDRADGIGLKWPNDIVVDDPRGPRKLAGILVERVDTPTGPAAVLGIGINVHQSSSELPIEAATSLEQLVEGVPDRTEVLATVLASLETLLPLIDDTDALRRAYAGECVTLGREVRVDVPAGDPLTGTAVDIDAGGRLVVDTGSGEVPVGAGDVIHVRAQA
ncbi:biotin--[acetyl-CoA-carboxylase] ligase [Nocardioides phosphati]|uniref:biotin--[biotin carboxyl-carrier protein] ligase n=1 Tax=Nocardioides phosphati TaxID=1867775 RepID=A0ABQ2N671_9ACTN|nr:biotin--[acetyl-CoA-carboxylase] ligase [Nocardioides phosphati]GGO84624.1 biotin--[acetyl-CoA-carboxylase] ligase [Nocardioides phosphati]